MLFYHFLNNTIRIVFLQNIKLLNPERSVLIITQYIYILLPECCNLFQFIQNQQQWVTLKRAKRSSKPNAQRVIQSLLYVIIGVYQYFILQNYEFLCCFVQRLTATCKDQICTEFLVSLLGMFEHICTQKRTRSRVST